MKTLWSLISFLAVVNLLALGMAVGWLWRTGRLDSARIETIRSLLAEPVSEEDEADGGADEMEGAAADPAIPPHPSAVEARHLSRLREQELLTRRRIEDERDRLRTEMRAAIDDLAAQREADATSLAAREASAAAGRTDEAAAQFAKAVLQLESIPPRQAKQILVTLVNAGDAPQAVAYLDAMKPRSAARVLREFKQPDEIELAADLLERLRTLVPEMPIDAAPGRDAT